MGCVYVPERACDVVMEKFVWNRCERCSFSMNERRNSIVFWE